MTKKVPRPNDGPVRGSRSGRPIMVLLDLLGRRMALRVLWELHGERLTFRALQTASGASPSVLNTRLAELRAAGFVDHDGNGYVLTTMGADLVTRYLPLHDWAEAWAKTRG